MSMSKKLAERFQAKIDSGEWPAESKIPTERQLMGHYRASRNSIRSALKLLEERKLLQTVQGSGRSVTKLADDKPRKAMIGLLGRGGEFNGGQNLRLLSAVDEAVAQRGMHLTTFSIHYDDQTVASANDPVPLEIDKLDGAIVMARQYQSDDVARLRDQIPVVTMTLDATDVQVPSYFIDFGVHAAIAVDQLVRMGHRHIMLTFDDSPFHNRIGSDMRRGFATGLLMHGIEPTNEMCRRLPLADISGKNLYKELRQTNSDITAVVSYGEGVPMGMIEEARAAGEDLLERMSFICLTDMEISKRPAGLFAHFKCPLEQLASDAVAELTSMIGGQSPSEIYHSYHGNLVEGKSFQANGFGSKNMMLRKSNL